MALAPSRKADTRTGRHTQLPLFAEPPSSLPSPSIPQCAPRPQNTRERLRTLLAGELNFHGEDSGYASHDVHAFAAKFPPQLPRTFIQALTAPGDLVLDPMMGSGTTVVEALLAGRRGVGLDLDPLAIRVSQVKTTSLDTDHLRRMGQQVLARAQALVATPGLTPQCDAQTQAFIDYWFLPQTQRDLVALVRAIREVPEVTVRRFLELTLSSIIITKSGGISRARDLAHSRPHLDLTKVPKNALEQFALRLERHLHSLAHLPKRATLIAPLAGDARAIPLRAEVVDLIITSPPYANAIDYMRAHKFSLVWLGASVSHLAQLRAAYLGAERDKGLPDRVLPERPATMIRHLATCDRGKARALRPYFLEMTSVCAEMYRVLHPGAAAIVVVGPSVLRGLNVQTHQCLADIAETCGFDVVGVVQRVLDRNKRMMPARFGKKTEAMIEQRMHEEYVLGLLKPLATLPGH
jgi:DNA modification methylase